MRRAALLALALAACTPAPPAERETSRDFDYGSYLADIDACGYVNCSGPHHPAEGLEFGALLMGEPVSAMPENATDPFGDCVSQHASGHGPPGSCSFILDGIVYVVSRGKVATKNIFVDRPPAAGLPFGLRGDETAEQTLAIVQATTDVPFVIERMGATAFVSNDEAIRNSNGAPMWLSIWFTDEGRLGGFTLQDLSVEAD